MRFQIASDLHLEALCRFPRYRAIEPAPGADALILAGDIHAHTHCIEAFHDWPTPVYYVHGNHEPMDAHYWGLVRELTRRSAGARVHYLEKSTVSTTGVRILGCCLWTDYALDGKRAEAMREAARVMPEHRAIRVGHGHAFMPSHALAEHQKSRQWLNEELDRPFDGKTIVVSHHAPHRFSVHPKFQGDLLNAAFASDLTLLLEKADIWVHGHMHHSSSYQVGRCTVVCNPLGYPRNASDAMTMDELRFENAQFNPTLTLDL
ncbi:Metallophos domain-containing protein [Paraburkholderia sabiae]|uniref:metallophosphoesterase family protein n=1 Tax=Paraburkholderia sabiae TaxID=273251 RepID=UPI001CAC8E80|nr:metallophosphoesterase family protein [Paraburkholderia sabiae]CAG9225937.1 Metallophos domain-containing protein [Paraburkholderia sabiae]